MQKKYIFNFLILIIFFSGCAKYNETEPDPNSPFVWVVGEQTLIKSTDAGNSWIYYSDIFDKKYLRISKENITLRSISFITTTYGIFAGNDSLFYCTIDASNWRQGKINKSPLTIYSSVKIDSSISYCCGKNGFAASVNNDNMTDEYASSESTSRVTKFATNTIYDLHSIDFINSSTGWVVGDSSTVLYTSDKGLTWTKQITASGNNYNAVLIHSASSSTKEIWIIGEKGVIFKTTDNGTTWIQISSGTTEDLTAIYFTGSSTAFITGSNGLILKTTDNGSSFQKLNSGTSETLNSISFMDENYGIAVGNKGVMLKTSDSGNSWSMLSPAGTKNLNCVCFVKRFKK